MPRRRVAFTQGTYYHIYNRGAAQVSIFRSDEDYRYLLTLVKGLLTELQITMIAYCLLPNHGSAEAELVEARAGPLWLRQAQPPLL